MKAKLKQTIELSKPYYDNIENTVRGGLTNKSSIDQLFNNTPAHLKTEITELEIELVESEFLTILRSFSRVNSSAKKYLIDSICDENQDGLFHSEIKKLVLNYTENNLDIRPEKVTDVSFDYKETILENLYNWLEADNTRKMLRISESSNFIIHSDYFDF